LKYNVCDVTVQNCSQQAINVWCYRAEVFNLSFPPAPLKPKVTPTHMPPSHNFLKITFGASK